MSQRSSLNPRVPETQIDVRGRVDATVFWPGIESRPQRATNREKPRGCRTFDVAEKGRSRPIFSVGATRPVRLFSRGFSLRWLPSRCPEGEPEEVLRQRPYL